VQVAPTQTSTYQITCTGANGSSTSNAQQGTVTVTQPVVNLNTSSARVAQGGSVQVTWTSSGVLSCAVSGPNLSSTATNGTQSVVINSQATFSITCQTRGTPITNTAVVNINGHFQEF
jgi:hypothetical protein